METLRCSLSLLPDPGPSSRERRNTPVVCFPPTKYMLPEQMNTQINQNLFVLCFNSEHWFFFFPPQSHSVLTYGLWCSWCCSSSQPWPSSSSSTSALWVITGASLMAEVRPATTITFLHCRLLFSILSLSTPHLVSARSPTYPFLKMNLQPSMSTAWQLIRNTPIKRLVRISMSLAGRSLTQRAQFYPRVNEREAARRFM